MTRWSLPVLTSLTLLALALSPLCELRAQTGTWDRRFGPAPLNSGGVEAVAIAEGRDVYIGGRFSWIDSTRINNIARWDGAAGRWMTLDSGVNGIVYDIEVVGQKVYVVGDFTRAGSVPARCIAVWDQATERWSALGDTSQVRSGGFRTEIVDIVRNGTDLYVGGNVLVVADDSARCVHLARWDMTSQTWHAVAGGIEVGEYVTSLAVADGQLYVAGSFSSVGDGVAAATLARLDLASSTWSALAGWTPGQIDVMLPLGPILYVGGLFEASPARQANIARWNTVTGLWEKQDTGVGDTYRGVSAMAFDGERLHVGLSWPMSYSGYPCLLMLDTATGRSTTAGAQPNGWVYDIEIVGAGREYVAGTFNAVGRTQAPLVAVRDLPGEGWLPLTSHRYLAVSGVVRAMHVAGSGEVYVGGSFRDAGFTRANNVALWNGSGWDSLGAGVDGVVRALALRGDELFVGGDFVNAGGARSPFLARWDRVSRTWGIDDTLDGSVHAILVAPNGDVYIGGAFTTIGRLSARGIARWDGSGWSTLGEGTTNGVDGDVRSLAMVGNDLYVGGMYAAPGGDESISHLARWSTTQRAWFAIGDGVDNAVTALHAIGGTLIASGPFTRAGTVPVRGIARWDGSTWTALGQGLSGNRSPLAVTTHGRYLVATGGFSRSDADTVRRLAGFDYDRRWRTIGGGIDSTGLVIASVGDDLYVGGEFKTAGGVVSPFFAIWHGTAAAVPSTNGALRSLSLTIIPNPINASGVARFTTQRAGSVRLSVVDPLGVERRVLHEGWLGPGAHDVRVALDGLSAGSYVLRLEADETMTVVPVVKHRR